jgi:capsular exopolysaccharide synthesis family protein
LIELLNDLVRTPKDVSKYLHLRLLGMIPDASEDEQADEIDPASIVRDAPYSIISECYRRFRANLKLLAPADSLKALLVTSPIAGEGKTSTAVNLATAFIAEEKNILLIDTNFRRPGFGSIFNDDSDETTQKGLSSFLRGKSSLDDIIRSNVIEGLDVINAGAMPTNPTELLDSNRMKNFIQQQRDNYDHIIIDGPPVLLVSDAKIMTGLVDATILVFNTEETRRGVALRSIRELRQINATIAGCVLLGVKSLKGGYFREQFKSYKEYQKPQLVTTS